MRIVKIEVELEYGAADDVNTMGEAVDKALAWVASVTDGAKFAPAYTSVEQTGKRFAVSLNRVEPDAF